jgi:ribosomal protein L34E
VIGVRELAWKLRHSRIVRLRSEDGRMVVFTLDSAADYPHCPDCGGVGGWGEFPDMQRCPRCVAPLAEIRIPHRLYRRIPGAPVVFVPWQGENLKDDDPPF